MKTQWHLSRLKSHDYRNKKRAEMLTNKPYQCVFCRWRTDSMTSMLTHVSKYDGIFVHGIENPHGISRNRVKN